MLMRRSVCFIRSRSGLTLLEAVYAIFLMGVVGMIFGTAFPMAILSRRASAERSQAISIALKQIEGLRAVGYKNLTYSSLRGLNWIDSSPTSSPYSITNVDQATGDNIGALLAQGTGTIEITEPSTGLRQVTVTVSWRDRKNNQRQVSLTTFVHSL